MSLLRKKRVLVAMATLLLISSIALSAKKKSAPLTWVTGTILEIDADERYDGDRVTSSRTTSAEYAPVRLYTIETERYTYRIRWVGSSGAPHNGGGVLGMALDGWEMARAGNPPPLSVGQELSVAAQGGFLYVDLGKKRAPGYSIVSITLTRKPQAQAATSVKTQAADTRTDAAPADAAPSTLRESSSNPALTPPEPATDAVVIPAEPSAKITLTIDSVPGDAKIELNGKRVGQTPLEISVDAGLATVVMEKTGYLLWATTMVLRGGNAIKIKPNLKAVISPPLAETNKTSIFVAANGVSAPVVLYKVDPAYSEEARNAKLSGAVVVQLVVDAAGRPRDILVIRGLGLGLDEKAIEAVSQWKFRPGMRAGKPVAVQATIEVNFRLL